MPDYRRLFQSGGMWFFTVNLLERKNNDLSVREIDLLRESVRKMKKQYPFEIVAWSVMPEHMHCIWKLPEGDTDFPLRWRLIKSHFSRNLPPTEYRSPARRKSGERGVWQKHYWEHLIRDETDLQRHIDYIHVNPLKHCRVKKVRDWPYSTFHLFVKRGIYPPDWCGTLEDGDFGE